MDLAAGQLAEARRMENNDRGSVGVRLTEPGGENRQKGKEKSCRGGRTGNEWLWIKTANLPDYQRVQGTELPPPED